MRATIAVIAFAALSQTAAAAVYKCTGADGKVEFRDFPCAGKTGQKVEIKPNTVTPIDQTSDRWLGNQISERAAQRADEEDRAALQRANSRPAPYVAESYDNTQYWYPGYYPRRNGQHARPTTPAPAPRTVPVTPSKLRDDK